MEKERMEHIKRLALPQQYVDENLGKGIEAHYLEVFIHNEAREVLQSFLNGGFSKLGFALYPLVQDVSMENRLRLNRIRKAAKMLHQKNGEFAASSAFVFPIVSSSSCARFLSLLFGDLSSLKRGKTIQVRKKPCEPFDLKDYDEKDKEYLKPVSELSAYAKKHISKDILGFYLHGSLATNDFVKGWSDCDTLLVISKEASQDPEKLLSLRKRIFHMRRFFLKIDPLQHHGCMVISEHDFFNYSQAYFPLPLFSYAKSLSEDNVSLIHQREMGPQRYEKLYWFVEHFRRMKREGRSSLGSYEAKSLLHLIALFPSLYLQAKEVYVYKKFSFEMARKDFHKEVWRPIETMTKIREGWRPFPELPFVRMKAMVNPVAAYQANAIVGDAVLGMKRKNNVAAGELVSQMGVLAEEAWEKIAKRI